MLIVRSVALTESPLHRQECLIHKPNSRVTHPNNSVLVPKFRAIRKDADGPASREDVGIPNAGTTLPCSADSLGWLPEAVPDAMAIVGANDALRFVNAAWGSLFGYREAELVGAPITSLLGEGPVDAVVPFALPSKGPAQRERAEMVGRKKDGSWFPIDVSAVHHVAPGGAVRVVIVRDMTERWQDEDLSQSAQELERKRISDEIHDGSIQSITAASLRLQQLRRGVTDAADLEILTTIEGLLEITSVGLRELMVKLHAPGLDGLGFATAIRELLEVLRADYGVATEVRNRLRQQPGFQRRVTLFRIAEDALRAACTARPNQVVVEIDDRNHGFLLRLQHDGTVDVGTDFATAADRARIAVRARLGGGWARFDRRVRSHARASIWIPADALAVQGSAA
jgi:PAS domain S-box-containing protein